MNSTKFKINTTLSRKLEYMLFITGIYIPDVKVCSVLSSDGSSNDFSVKNLIIGSTVFPYYVNLEFIINECYRLHCLGDIGSVLYNACNEALLSHICSEPLYSSDEIILEG